MSAIATFSALAPMETQEAQIARGLSRRDPDTIEALIDQYRHRLMRYLLHMLGNRVVAEDMFQETWVRVLEKGSLYDGRTPFAAWLLSIARNLTIDYMRKRQRAGLEPMNDDPEEGPVFEAVASTPSPYEVAAAHEEAATIAEALGRVPPAFREVLVLRFQEQMKLEEIATLTGVPLATVKSRLYRGVAALRPALERNLR
jgi:RNA polymerase sigma-70 factor (ECF subfamily)